MKPQITETLSVQCCIARESILTPTWYAKNSIIPYSKLYYITDGEIEIEIQDQKIIASRGDVVLIPARTKHSCYMTPLKYAKKYWTHFELKNGNYDFFDDYILPYKIHVDEQDDSLIKLFKSLIQYMGLPSPQHQLLAGSVMLKIVSFYFSKCFIKRVVHAQNEIDEIILYIKNNYNKKFSLEELAKRVNYTPNYFIKKFKKRTGISPIQFINNVKIEAVKFMLCHSNYPISTIMEKTGFMDESYFAKLFKKNTGYSPLKFRELYLNNPLLKDTSQKNGLSSEKRHRTKTNTNKQ